MLTSQNPYGFRPGQPLAPGQPLPGQYFPGQPLPGQPLTGYPAQPLTCVPPPVQPMVVEQSIIGGQQLIPGQSIIGGQALVYPPGLVNPFTGIIALLVFAASVAINTYSGHWGAGFFGAAACPSTHTSEAIIIAVYVVFGLALLYAVYTRTWPDQAYNWAIAASVLNTLALASRVWWRHSHSSFWRLFGSHTVHLLLLIALVVVLYNLWWSIYWPINFDWLGAFARNAVSFYLGWALFSAVKALWFVIGHFLEWKGHGNRFVFWVLQLLAFATVFGMIYRLVWSNSFQSLAGFVLVALWAFVACLLRA